MRNQSGLHFQITGVLILWIGSGALLALSLTATDGRLIYTLDDPYIHLAVAENILLGSYGVNVGEFASPSSSIVWPLLMAAMLKIGAGDWAPWVVSISATSVATWILCGTLYRCVSDREERGTATWLPISLIPLFLLSVNAFALPLTGMEHPLHVMASVLVIAGLARLADSGALPWYLPVSIVVAPLIRFEGLALSAAAIAVLTWSGHGKAAMWAGFGLAILLAAWFGVSLSLGLPAMPSSVLVKSGLSAAALDADYRLVAKTVVLNVINGLNTTWGMLFALGGASMVAAVSQAEFDAKKTVVMVAVPTAVVLFGHIAGGRYGWFGRYEVYAVAVLLMASLWLYRSAMRGIQQVSLRVMLLVLFMVPIGAGYLNVTRMTPAASKNIYQQQYQMHRFATLYFPHAVAVNDLGWVAYENDRYVLDLWGLGSEEIRTLRRVYSGAALSERLDEVVRQRDTVFAMVYEKWFQGVVPVRWCKIAELNTSRVTAADGRVAFYLIDKAFEEDMRRALRHFASDLPAGAGVEVFGCMESGRLDKNFDRLALTR